MVTKIENQELEALYKGHTFRGKPKYPKEVIIQFAKRVKMLENAQSITEIRNLKGLNFEALKGNLKGKYSVRVNDKYRIILRREKQELIVEVLIIEDLSNHYQ